MDKNEEPAKRLFLKYCGSHFFMDRGGEWKKYKAYGISRDQELAWARERRGQHLRGFENEVVATTTWHHLTTLISASSDVEGLVLLMEQIRKKAPELDTFTLILFANQLLEYADKLHYWQDPRASALRLPARALAKELFKYMTEKPISIHEYYKRKSDLRDILNKKAIGERIERIRKRLAKG